MSKIAEQPSRKILLPGLLSLALAACSGGSTDAGNTSGGSTGTSAGGSAGTASGSGGALGSGGAGQPSNGGMIGSGGSAGTVSTGGASSAGAANGGATSSGGMQAAGGAQSAGGSTNASGGSAQGGAMSGGKSGSGGGTSGGASGSGGKNNASGGSTGSGGASTGGSSGTCTASKSVSTNVSGTGPHQVVVETNSDAGIKEGTIYRPKDLGGAEKYPIFVWGEGGCSLNGLSNSAAMAEIASHGYFVIADGTPNNGNSRSMNTNDIPSMGKPLLAYVTWAIAENGKSCSAYYQSLDTTKVGANGFSCGGLMAEGTAGDPRITTWGLNSSGMFSANQNFYKTVHTPVLIVLGGPSDIAYENGERDYDNISALNLPIMLFSKDLGHGGDLFSRNGGDFTKINLAWLNWWLKGDETATGKGRLVGSGCSYCTDKAWEVKSKNVP